MAENSLSRYEKEYLEYLFKIYSSKTALGELELQKLADAGYIPQEEVKAFIGRPSAKSKDILQYIAEEDTQREIDFKTLIILNKDKTEEECDGWKPESVVRHSEEFISFIDSFLYSSFENIGRYEPYEKYKSQCYLWLSDTTKITDFKTQDGKKSYVLREYKRCKINTLYFLEKYYVIKEGSNDSGIIKYYAKEHNRLTLFMLDCGYSLMIGKPRQGYFTTTMAGYALKKALFQNNFYMKYITITETKGQEIFRDKVKSPFGDLPEFFKPKVESDNLSQLRFGARIKKGEFGKPNTLLETQAPTITAINGGAPQLVFIDEVDDISVLTEMMLEARPTMFIDKKGDGNLEMTRQIVMWGCVCAGTKVFTNEGKMVNIEDLNKEEGILGYDSELHKISNEEITYWQLPAEKPCYRITTHTGRYLECSEDHPILWSSVKFADCIEHGMHDGKRVREFVKKTKFVETKDLKVGEQIAVIEEIPIWGEKEMWHPRVVGWLIGDGSYGGKKTPVMSNCDDEINNYLEANFDTALETQKITKSGKIYKELRLKNIFNELREVGIKGQSRNDKRMPTNCHLYTKQNIADLLGGFFDTDGCVHYTGKTRYIDLTSSCFELLYETMFLLQKFGIHSRISKRKPRMGGYSKTPLGCYELHIRDVKSIKKFHKNITFAIKYKQERLESVINDLKDMNGIVSRNSNGLRFEKITKIEFLGNKPIYNLTAGNTNTYIANGIVTHNTGMGGNKGKGAYEREWYRILSMWENKEHGAGIIPMFFDWTIRCSKKVYLDEKATYYGGKNQKDLSLDESKRLFHMHYPSTFKDMFASNTNTLVPREIIEDGYSRIRTIAPSQAPQYGYFEPVFDRNVPTGDNSDVPFKIVDARFVPLDDTQDIEEATCLMLVPPDRDWRKRYYQGTDPIAVETGYSKMSSVIWDKHLKAPVCIVNYRRQYDHKYSFLQCFLMGLYYDTDYNENAKRGCPELVENNIGTNYTDYVEVKGGYARFIYNRQLPDKLVGGSRTIGIDNKGTRSMSIIDKMRECVRHYHQHFYFLVIYNQLETFVRKDDKQTESWARLDKRLHYDDVLYALVYAYICSLCYETVMPFQVEKGETEAKKVKFGMKRDKNWNLVQDRRI